MSAELYAFRRNVVLVASAGTGKTHALVGVLLHALLGVSELARGAIDPARIAATTFSRKAAAEIRERLVSELERLAFGAPSTYAAPLVEAASRLSIAWGPAVCADHAQRALAGIDRATIGTLHGLAYSIARAHALAVGLPPSFAVASEDDTEAWANESVTTAMAEHAAREPEAIRDLFRLMRGTDRAQAELVRLLAALEEDGRGASALVVPEGDAETIASRVEDVVLRASRIAGDPRYAAPAHALVEAHARDDFEALAIALPELLSVRKPRGEDDWLPAREDLPGTSNRERGELLAHAWAARHRIAGTSRLVRDLLARAQSLLAEAHARAGAVGFGAALRLARDALKDDPIAASRASAAYDCLLVDEFQDTSRVQVELLRLLWERDPRSRASGALPVFGDLRPKGLLVVGDRKQSIYAFRGADVGVFVATCIELAGARARDALDVSADAVPLPARTTADFFALRENYRSNAAVIAFVNAFSRVCLRPESDDLSEARYAEDVESLVATSSTRQPSSPRVTWMRPPGDARETTRLEDATIAAAYIADAMKNDHNDDGTELAYRDFAVLAQSNEMLDAAAFAMSRAGIPHVVAGRGFFAAREVQDLLALLRFIDRPDDRAALLSVLRGPCAALSDRTLLGLTEAHRGLVTDLERWDTLDRRGFVEEDDRAALERVRATLRALRRSAERLGPARTLREAVRELEIEQTLLLMPRGVQRIANVRKLLRIAEDDTTIRGLLDRVARAEARAREPEAATFSEDDDAVRLVTMHASKGLAFRVVLLPELKGSPIRSANTTLGLDLRSDPAWIATKVLDDRGEPVSTPSVQRLAARDRARLRADRRRLMYVAVTRARERIVFIGGVKSAPRADPHFGAIVSELASGGGIEVRDASTDVPSPVAGRDALVDVALAPPIRPHTLEVAIAPTALQDFRHCARRFELVHVVSLPEPTPTALGRFRTDGMAATNARAEGEALHRVLERIDIAAFGARDARDRASEALVACDVGLEREAEARVLHAAARFLESDYARSVREGGAETSRERAFVVTVEAGDVTVTLRGAMDLLVTWRNGDIDVVDYKRARGPDARPHAFQLDVYALAARAQLDPLHALTARVRAGAVFLGGEGAPEPRFRAPLVAAKLEEQIAALAKKLLEARRADRFPRAPPKTCHAIGCGYFTLCHPAKEKRQLTLFR